MTISVISQSLFWEAATQSIDNEKGSNRTDAPVILLYYGFMFDVQ